MGERIADPTVKNRRSYKPLLQPPLHRSYNRSYSSYKNPSVARAHAHAPLSARARERALVRVGKRELRMAENFSSRPELDRSGRKVSAIPKRWLHGASAT